MITFKCFAANSNSTSVDNSCSFKVNCSYSTFYQSWFYLEWLIFQFSVFVAADDFQSFLLIIVDLLFLVFVILILKEVAVIIISIFISTCTFYTNCNYDREFWNNLGSEYKWNIGNHRCTQGGEGGTSCTPSKDLNFLFCVNLDLLKLLNTWSDPLIVIGTPDFLFWARMASPRESMPGKTLPFI